MIMTVTIVTFSSNTVITRVFWVMRYFPRLDSNSFTYNTEEMQSQSVFSILMSQSRGLANPWWGRCTNWGTFTWICVSVLGNTNFIKFHIQGHLRFLHTNPIHSPRSSQDRHFLRLLWDDSPVPPLVSLEVFWKHRSWIKPKSDSESNREPLEEAKPWPGVDIFLWMGEKIINNDSCGVN